jgi:hypothetical protein
VGQALPNTHSKRADGVMSVQVTQVRGMARAQARDERAVPQVTKIQRINQARDI